VKGSELSYVEILSRSDRPWWLTLRGARGGRGRILNRRLGRRPACFDKFHNHFYFTDVLFPSQNLPTALRPVPGARVENETEEHFPCLTWNGIPLA